MINGYYINLKKRKDRKLHIQKIIEQKNFLKKIERFPAIYHSKGAIGCSLSHYCVLTLLENVSDDFFIILEDDFQIIKSTIFDRFTKHFQNIKDNDWDLITLNPWGRYMRQHEKRLDNDYKDNNFKRIIDTQTTVGYIIKKSFIPILKRKILYGVYKMIQGEPDYKYTIDQIWKTLQRKYKFIAFKERFCRQKKGYSDIEKMYVNY